MQPATQVNVVKFGCCFRADKPVQAVTFARRGENRYHPPPKCVPVVQWIERGPPKA